MAASIVVARGWTWRVEGAVPCGAVTRVAVEPLEHDAPRVPEFLIPFDRLHPHRVPRRWRRAPRGYLSRVLPQIAAAWPSPALAGAAGRLELLRHQLGPAVAVLRGFGCRLLLADAVGAGKTIEAALVIAELAARGLASHVLVLTPASLRDQWRGELALRAGLDALVVDREVLARRSRELPPGVGPWQPPGLHVLSTELAKQPDVLAGLTSACWDVLIVDESHGVAGDSARTSAVRAVAARARVLLLLTATPHSGDDAAFARLCGLGRLGDEPPLLMFARARQRLPVRRRDVAVRTGAEERRCLHEVARYAAALERCGTPGAALVGLVLRKRALSSPAALLHSVQYRLRCIDAGGAPEQPLLPFHTGEHEHEDADQPGVLANPSFLDTGIEARLLTSLARHAEEAARHWSKARVLLRLLRRTGERALVFTEYRDTLDALAGTLGPDAGVAVLHGGLDRDARTESLDRFRRGDARVLIATDVASEGLNLHEGCRLVVHVELPWSPTRLEQRNGRVDRFGQRRRVHVWRLLGDGRFEWRVVSALAARLARMRAQGFETLAHPGADAPPAAAPTHGVVRIAIDELEEEACRATAMIATLRRLAAGASRPAPPPPSRHVRRWMRVRPVPGGVPRGVLCLFLTRPGFVGARRTLVPVHVALRRMPPGHPSQWLGAIVERAATVVHDARDEPLRRMLRGREARLAAAVRVEHDGMARAWQPSLFDRRAASIVAAARETAAARVAAHERRLQELSGGAPLPPMLLLALLVS
ncbi:MAG TPA: DEAD/DEAH box helicase [Vicinamibacterales bacterium]